VGGHFNCAVLANDEFKCWGSNNAGQLGLEDTNDRGDGLDIAGNFLEEMGDALPAVNLGREPEE
jgi:hypothetical protein